MNLGVFFRFLFSFFTAFVFSSNLYAGKHVHDEAEMSLAVDGKKVLITLDSPAISVYGFEHEPKDAKEMARRESAVQKLVKEIGGIVAFDSALGCKLTKHDVNPFKHEDDEDNKHTHGNLFATFDFECAKALKGGGAVIKIASVFPDIKRLDVTIVGAKQSSIVVHKSGARVSF